MVELEAKDNLIAIHQKMIEEISNNLDIAVWGKDINGRFLYVNAACCRNILKCSEEEAISMSDTDFVENALAKVCIESDQKVIDRGKSIRFIEHGRYKKSDLFLDTTKSPWFRQGVIIGTVGVGTNISDQISDKIKEKFKSIGSIEIPIGEDIKNIFKI